MESRIQRTLKNLKLNNMSGYFEKDQNCLMRRLKELIPEGSTVGSGDSATLEDLGIFDYLKNGNYIFYDKHRQGLTSEEKRKLYINNFSADIFISGANAITEQGEIINIDGNGSRVAPMIYGPRKVVFVIGTNKLTEDWESGLKRARQIAAPLDARRLGKDTPCVKLGKCVDCNSRDRICNSFVTLSHQFDSKRIHVIIVQGNWGF